MIPPPSGGTDHTLSRLPTRFVLAVTWCSHSRQSGQSGAPTHPIEALGVMLRMTPAQSLLDSIVNNVNAVADKTLDRVEEDCFKAPPKALGIGKAPKQQKRKVKFLGVRFIRVSGAGEAVPEMPQATAIWYLPACSYYPNAETVRMSLTRSVSMR